MTQDHKKIVIILIILWLLGTLYCIYSILITPSAEKNQILLNLSIRRLIPVIFLFILLLIQIFLIIFVFTGKKIGFYFISFVNNLTKKIPLDIFNLSIFISLLSWVFYLISPSFFGGYQELFLRMKPIILSLCISFTTCTLILLIMMGKVDTLKIKQKIIGPKKYSGLFFLIFFFLLFLWSLIFIARIGLNPDGFWDKVGVPILLSQVLISFFITLCIFKFIKLITTKKISIQGRTPIIIGLFIWLATSIIWILVPQPTSTFNPGPFLPNNQYYPNKDALLYDMCAQHALMGNGYCGLSHHCDKPLYSFLLLLFHLIVGQNTNNLLILQTFVFSIFPVILFFIGNEIQGYLTGLFLAALSIFKVRNSIAASLIIWKVSHPKMMMSEFPLAILLSLLLFFMIRLFKTGEKRYLYFIAGISSLATLIRHNAWILLPMVILISIYYLYSIKKPVLLSTVFIIIFFFSILIPWVVRNKVVGKPPFTFIAGVEHVVWENRYMPDLTNINQPKNNLADNQDLALSLQNALKIINSVIKHYFHNIVGTFVALPTTLQINTLRNTIVSQTPISFWDANWRGEMSFPSALLMLINIILIALGISFSIKKEGVVGFLPTILFIFNNLGISIARTSGGRYLVPIDWIILIYYSLGILVIYRSFNLLINKKDPLEEKINKTNTSKSIKPRIKNNQVLVIFILIGLLITVPEFAIPEKNYPQQPNQTIYVPNKGEIIALEKQDSIISKFLENKNAILWSGKALYPRILIPGDDNYSEFFSGYPAQPFGLIFISINSGDGRRIYIPLKNVDLQFKDGQEVIVVGCQTGNYMTAISITSPENNQFLINPYIDNLICE